MSTPAPATDADLYDVAIVGGGPAGSTVGCLLRKYKDARVVILEREQFPREHVGESQLPPIGAILEEMGCWQEVEQANFPIKVGATMRWGSDDALWDIDFLPGGELKPQARPAAYGGQRKKTALQVDRATYDDILLRRAQTLGCEVRQQTTVRSVERDGDRVTGLQLADGDTVRARWYVDASGGTGLLRRAMGVATEQPGQLKNLAVWDYWDNVEWAETIGRGGTRVQVLSVGYGWIWFIPVSETRASVGLIMPAAYYKHSGQTPEALYHRALQDDARVKGLLAQAQIRGKLQTAKDWSFLAERAHGENWFLSGEAVGFADPILAAGMTLAQGGARELAYTLRALLEAEHDPAWLAENYTTNQRTRIWQHIRFADFWYATNGQFSQLQEHCKTIAADAGLSMSPEEAWSWLSQGGFTNDAPGQTAIGLYDLASVKQVAQRFLGAPTAWRLAGVNKVKIKAPTPSRSTRPYYREGKVVATPAIERDGKQLMIVGVVGLVVQLVSKFPLVVDIVSAVKTDLVRRFGAGAEQYAVLQAVQALEMLLTEGWIEGELDPAAPQLRLTTPHNGAVIHEHRDRTQGSPRPADADADAAEGPSGR